MVLPASTRPHPRTYVVAATGASVGAPRVFPTDAQRCPGDNAGVEPFSDTIGVDDVAQLRSLLRRPDRAARDLAVTTLKGWKAHRLDVLGARAVLEAAAGSYPTLPGDEVSPAVRFVELLWDDPCAVTVVDVVRVHLVATEPVQRALLHLLALRGGDEGLAGLEVLIGPEAEPRGVPRLTAPILGPLLIQVDSQRVARLLIHLLGFPGWRWHAAELLGRLDSVDALDDDSWELLAEALSDHVDRLATACDRAMRAQVDDHDPARATRQSLATLVALLERQMARHAGEVPDAALRLLGSADPRVSAFGAGLILRFSGPVAPERLELIGRDPVARVELVDLLAGAEAPSLPPSAFDEVSLEEGRLVRQLAEPHELGRIPDEIEHLGAVMLADQHGGGVVHVFRFRVRSPHWSAARGWMIGVGGPFNASCYAAEEDDTLEGHVESVRVALSDRPHRADG